MVKTLSIKDEVYEKLLALKNNESFSELLERLVEKERRGKRNVALAVLIMERIRKKYPGKKVEKIIREERDGR